MKPRTPEVTIAYLAIAIVMTWPLASRITVDIAADFGDPLLNCWILNWTGGVVLEALSGDPNALHRYWHGNIFHPEPLTIAYSEHLTPQMLQILPIIAITDNVVLGYNLLFLSTYVLSGLGMFLLVRDLTGRPGAAFVAGLAYAFAPFRLAQLSHLQVLSSQWMPFALLWLRRAFESFGHGGTGDTGDTGGRNGRGGSGRRTGLTGATESTEAAENTENTESTEAAEDTENTENAENTESTGNAESTETGKAGAVARADVASPWRSLAFATAAIVVQGLSCGYYLVFFPPVVAAYSLYEMTRRKLLRNWRVWRTLAAAAIVAALVTWPFVSPYLELRRQGALGERSYSEVVLFSANSWAFGTASSLSRLLGRVQPWPEGEGYGYPGLTIVGLAVIGAGWGLWRALAHARLSAEARLARWLFVGLTALLAIDAIALVELLVDGTAKFGARSEQLMIAAAILIAALLAASPAARRIARGTPGSMLGVAVAGVIASALLALGPEIRVADTLVGAGPYWLFHRLMPGADAVRVPARFLMLLAMFLAMLAGYGGAALLSRHGRIGGAALSVAGLLILAESWMAPLPLSRPLSPVPGFHTTTDRLATGATLGPIYQRLRNHPGEVVLIEFPYANLPYDILATYYAGYHRKPLINGFSGFFPGSYYWRTNYLRGLPADFDAATTALRATGATHAIVHEGAITGGRGRSLSEWLRSIGAEAVVRDGDDVLFRLPW